MNCHPPSLLFWREAHLWLLLKENNIVGYICRDIDNRGSMYLIAPLATKVKITHSPRNCIRMLHAYLRKWARPGACMSQRQPCSQVKQRLCLPDLSPKHWLHGALPEPPSPSPLPTFDPFEGKFTPSSCSRSGPSTDLHRGGVFIGRVISFSKWLDNDIFPVL